MVVTLEIDLVSVPDWLVAEELLCPDHGDDRRLIEEALQKAVTALALARSQS